jgi:carboxypeptidase Q
MIGFAHDDIHRRRTTMRRTLIAISIGTGLLMAATSAQSQTPAGHDPVIEKIRTEGQERSQLYPLAQTLMDSIGPRLTGTVEQLRANEWLLATYRRWGIPVRAEKYGTWLDWRREIAHIDLIAPRRRPLDGMLSTWSPGTKGTIEGQVVVNPDVQSAAEFEAWLPKVLG